MQDWTGGYVTEIEYTSGFYAELAPVKMNFALLSRGIAAPAAGQAYNWLEVGCGNGLSANALAATNPHANFYAFDFNPTHIQNAERVAREAGLRNVHFFEDSFEQARQRGLPPMDYIVLHGIYSWVNAENRAHIVELIRSLLKPGGVVYVSYNCLPGWANKAPLRRLMTEFASRRGGPVTERVDAARSFLATMKDAGVRYFAANPGGVALADNLATQDVSYLAHEYMNADWDLFYHADVVRDFSAAKLTYAASATLIENIDGATMPAKVVELVQNEADPVLRETLRDFGTNQQFRRDLFVRGTRRLNPADQAKFIGEKRFCLSRVRDECKLTVNLPVGEVTLSERLYGKILDALAEQPRTAGELAAMCDTSLDGCRTAMVILLAIGYVQLIVGATPESRASTQAFNIAALNRAVAGEPLSVLAAAELGTAVGVTMTEQFMLHAYLSKAANPAAHVLQVLRRQGRHLVHDGKALQTEEEAIPHMRDAYERFCNGTIPFLQCCGVIQA